MSSHYDPSPELPEAEPSVGTPTELGRGAVRSIQMDTELTARDQLLAEAKRFRQLTESVENLSDISDLPGLSSLGHDYLRSENGRELLALWYESFGDFTHRLDYIENPILSAGESPRDTLRLAESMRNAIAILVKRANSAGLKSAG